MAIHIREWETYKSTNDSSEVEDGPEPGDVMTLGLLWRVGKHDSSLGAPQDSSATS